MLKGCSSTASAIVTVNALPTATLSKAADVNCATPSTVLTAGTGTEYNFGSGFSATNTNTVFPSATTTYTVTVSSSAGCTASASVTVNADYNPPTPWYYRKYNGKLYFSKHNTYCKQENYYLWNTGDATASAVVTPIIATTYS